MSDFEVIEAPMIEVPQTEPNEDTETNEGEAGPPVEALYGHLMTEAEAQQALEGFQRQLRDLQILKAYVDMGLAAVEAVDWGNAALALTSASALAGHLCAGLAWAAPEDGE